MKRLLSLGATLLLTTAFVGACGNDDKPAANGAAADAAKITLVATDFKFDQSNITAEASKALTLTLKNDSGSTEHNLTIEELKVNKDVEAGKSASQTVTPAVGTYEYHCEYHPSSMKGTLTVR